MTYGVLCTDHSPSMNFEVKLKLEVKLAFISSDVWIEENVCYNFINCS